MKEEKIELKEGQRNMLNSLLRRSNDFTAMGWDMEHYYLIHTIYERGYYFPWDRKLLNEMREKYILWFHQLPF